MLYWSVGVLLWFVLIDRILQLFPFADFEVSYMRCCIFQSHEKANTQTHLILTLRRLSVCIFVEQIHLIDKNVKGQILDANEANTKQFVSKFNWNDENYVSISTQAHLNLSICAICYPYQCLNLVHDNLPYFKSTVCSFAWTERSALALTHQDKAPFLGSACKSFVRLGPPQRVDCLASIENKRKMSFPRTQERITSSGIEPRVSNLSITKPTLTRPEPWHFNILWKVKRVK